MAWIILLLAGLFEVVWAVGLKYTDGFTRLLPSVSTIAAMILSVGLLALAVRTLPLSIAYVVWTGIGAVGAVLFGVLLFNESISAARVICLLMIIAGIIGLKMSQ